MVVTDLKLHTTELPNKLALGEQLPLVAYFSEKVKKSPIPVFWNWSYSRLSKVMWMVRENPGRCSMMVSWVM